MAESARIVALGRREEIMGLASAGIAVAPVESPEDLIQALAEQAADQDVALLLVSETVARGAEGRIDELRAANGTAILLIPSHRGATGLPLEWMRRGMEQRIGVDMISEK